MNLMGIKRHWLAPDDVSTMRSAAYAIAEADFAKSNVANLILDKAGTVYAAAAHRLLDAFWRTPIASEYAHHFGVAPAVWLNFTTLRRHRAGETATYVSWHFDYNFFGRYDQALVVWVPLDKVGTDAPGLEFRIPNSELGGDAFARILRDGKLPHVLEDAQVETLMGPAGCRNLTAVVGPGDAVLFGPLVLHRTQLMAEASAERIAIEFRLVSAQRAPTRQGTASDGLFSIAAPDGQYLVLRYAELYGRS